MIKCGFLVAAMAALASAQSFNIDFGQPQDGPSSDYRAAGRVGFWNSIVAEHDTTTFNLRDVKENITNVRMWQFGGTETISADDPTTEGQDSLLLDDYLVTHNTNLESCLFFRGLQTGVYEVIIYGWMPNAPDVLSYTNVDEEPGNPHLEVGGFWSGEHEKFITYTRHVAIVLPGTNGLLRAHSGIVPLADPELGAALNGIQLRRLELGAMKPD